MDETQVMIITGTRKGIGKFLVHHYINKGFRVIGCSRGKVDYQFSNYQHFCLDVSDEKKVKQMLAVTRKTYGRLDVLINNAGIASMNHILLTPVNTVHNILNTNVVGTFLLCREAAKVMQKKKYGRIVNTSTVATPLKLEGEAIYAASKAAILSLTEIIARELSGFAITVNSVGPTPIETDLIRSVPKEKMDRLLARQAISRFGTFEDIANVIDFFIKKESEFVTGQNIYLGGI
ncbi:oxidoreductase [Candidatus Magnetomorum sp. HK-1]|nr:oxidoreductase [Candidatus Magnetomorum sp. HK-1]